MKKILVLLSTYNGAQFLREQIDSLLKQVDVYMHILVRDDGSTDNTKRILFEYKNTYPEKFTIIQGENLGWRHSFFELLCFAKRNMVAYDYYAFCDQDDIWLPTKLKRAVEKIGELTTDIRLYCSNLYYYKDGINFGLIRTNIWMPTPENCLILNYATGCTVLFNRNLLNALVGSMPKMSVNHDMWAYQVAVLLGSVYIDMESYILYRQHQGNQIGAKKRWRTKWTRRLKSFTTLQKRHEREFQARELERCFGEHLSQRSFKAVYKVAHYREKFALRFSLAFDKSYSTGYKCNDLWLKLRVLMGKL